MSQEKIKALKERYEERRNEVEIIAEQTMDYNKDSYNRFRGRFIQLGYVIEDLEELLK